MDRRNFVAASLAAMHTPQLLAKGDRWEQVRSLFPLEKGVVHMAGLLLTSHPKPVQSAIDHYARELQRNPVDAFHHYWQDAETKVFAAAADYMHTKADLIALTDSTTQGLGLIYTGLRLNRGDEIVTTNHDHYSTKTSLQYLSEQTGASIKRIDLYKQPGQTSAKEVVTNLFAAISPATRLVAITWVHSCNGVKLPIKDIGKRIAQLNKERPSDQQITYVVDGVHGFGVEELKVEDIGCDFFIAGCHKWLFGPRGTGIVWGRAEAWSAWQPAIPSFSAFYVKTPGRQASPGGFKAYEHRWALNEAFELHRQLGPAAIEQRIHSLNTQLKTGMAKIPGLTLHAPIDPAMSSAIVCFEMRGIDRHKIVDQLRTRKIIAGVTPYQPSYARLTPGLWNNEQEVEQTITALADIAKLAH